MRRQLAIMLASAFALVLVALGAWMLLQSISQPKWGSDVGSQSGSSNATSVPLSSERTLLEAALSVMKDIKNRDYASLSLWIHPGKGVTFTPYSTVKPDSDVKLSADCIKHASTDNTVYNWGVDSGKGDSIRLEIQDFFDSYVYDHDYLAAPVLGINQIMKEGNLPENVKTTYPNAQFVDFYFPGFEKQYGGMDWVSVKLVFEEYEGHWTLVAVIHSCWAP